ncbi:hypothetical protein DIPPA_35927 [Diplonema papillatum]|nr:hypothetical protein DIPPA_35927 [Diplonema papillatum]
MVNILPQEGGSPPPPGSGVPAAKKRFSVTRSTKDHRELEQFRQEVFQALENIPKECHQKLTCLARQTLPVTSVDFGNVPYSEADLMSNAGLSVELPVMCKKTADAALLNEIRSELQPRAHPKREGFRQCLRGVTETLLELSEAGDLHCTETMKRASDVSAKCDMLPNSTEVLEWEEMIDVIVDRLEKQGGHAGTDESREACMQSLVSLKEEEQHKVTAVVQSVERLAERLQNAREWVAAEKTEFVGVFDGEQLPAGAAGEALRLDAERLAAHSSSVAGRVAEVKEKLAEIEREKERALEEHAAAGQAHWRQIDAALESLRQLEMARFDEAAKRDVKAVVLQQQYMLLQRMTTVQAEHSARIEAEAKRIERIASDGRALRSRIESTFDEMCAFVDSEAAIVAKHLDAAHRYHLQVVDSLVRTLGQALLSNDDQRRALHESITKLKINYDVCLETMDPAAKELSTRTKALQIEKEGVDADSDNIKRKLTRVSDNFSCSAKYLTAEGVTFENPLLLVQDAAFIQKLHEYKMFVATAS